MSIGNELTDAGQYSENFFGDLSLAELPEIYQGLRRGLPTEGPGDVGYFELLNSVVGLGHWRVVAREAFCQEAELPSGGRCHEAGFDASVQLGNWAPQGFVVLAETPCTPGGYNAGTRWEARAGALSCAIMKALSYFGLGTNPAARLPGPVTEVVPKPKAVQSAGYINKMSSRSATGRGRADEGQRRRFF